nr:hypothetical protein BaRGS_028039 [Batillaria attramentaria]
MVALDNQRLVLADESNENLKLVTLTPLQLNSQVPAFTTPFGLAKMPDGRVAVTSSSENVILLIDFGKWKKRIVKTAKRYLGIGATAPPLKLIVSCCEGEGQRASVDVITVNGVLVRTIIGSGSLNHLYYPWFLHVAGGEVLISDNGTHSLTRVDVTTGQVLDTCTRGESEYLNQPLQLTQGEQGDVIVACFARRRVLMRCANGDWRGILYGAVDGDGEAVKPMAVAVVGSVLVVAWNSTPINYSVLAGYDMDDVYGEVNTAQSG